MKTIDLHQVDAFTDTLFGGNPAGVVTNADGLTDQDMANIAREMNLSETAFVLPAAEDAADIRLRFFTPSAEVKFCGHATVGALFQLAQMNLYNLGRAGANAVRVQAGVGILEMTVTNADDGTKVTFTAPSVKLKPYHEQGPEFADRFGVPASLIKAGAEILVDIALNYLYIPVASLKALSEQKFDPALIRKNFGAEGIVVFCLYTNETVGEGASLQARGLAPIVGIDEDPFTGSMQAGMVLAAKENGLIAPEVQEVITEQGHFIGRPGFAKVTHDLSSNAISVTASAVRVFSATIEGK